MAAPKNDNVKQQILDAAIALFQEQHDVSLAEIAKAANISKGTLFYHYRSKAEIYLDISERYWGKLSDDLLAWVDNKQKDTSIPRLVRYTFIRGVFDESVYCACDYLWRPFPRGRQRNPQTPQRAVCAFQKYPERPHCRAYARRGRRTARLAAAHPGRRSHGAKHHANSGMDVDAFIEWMARNFSALG
jgi:AcrR family transcriptional regulator